MVSIPWSSHVRAAMKLNPTTQRWPIALKASLTMLLVMGGPLALGFGSFGLLASLGAFTVLYSNSGPLRFRLKLLALVGAGFVASAAVGSVTHHWIALEVLSLAATTAIAVFFCVAMRIGPPGAFFFVLVQGVAGLAASHGAPPGRIIGATITGAVIAILMGMSDLLFDRTGPERKAVEAAEAAMQRFEDEADPAQLVPLRLTTSRALHSAWTAVTDAGSAPEFTERLWAVQDRYIAAARRVAGSELDIDPTPWGSAEGDEGLIDELDAAGQLNRADDAESRADNGPKHDGPKHAAPDPDDPDHGHSDNAQVDVEQLRDTSLGRPSASALLARAAQPPSEVLLIVSRAFAATLIAGSIAALLGNMHLYWAAASATLLLHQGGTREAQRIRAIQRVGGTIVGLGVFWAIQLLHPPLWGAIAVVVVLQFVIEILIAVNYGLAVMAITPVALTIGMHAAQQSSSIMVFDRLFDTLLAVVVSMAVLHLFGRHLPVQMLRSYARTVVVGIDRVLADLAADRTDSEDAKEQRRRLYHSLLESDEVARRALADDPARVKDYRAMERQVSDLGYLVLGLAWHPDAATARHLAEQARTPLSRILASSVREHRPAEELYAEIRAAEAVLRGNRA